MAMVHDGRRLAFGTDGVRGQADMFPFTNEALRAFGRALAVWARERYKKECPKFLIGADTRISSPRIKADLCHGMLQGGLTVFDAGILSTPAIHQIIFYDQSFDAGVIVSASHNSYHDNGIKVCDARHCKINTDDERIIIELFNLFLDDGLIAPVSSIGLVPWVHACDVYQQRVLSLFPAGFLKKVKVVVDCANGATFRLAPAIFSALGADVQTIAALPDGVNINENCGSMHPEGVAKAVLDQKADCGFAFDGDGDRVIAVNRCGMVKDGDDILALLCQLPEFVCADRIVGTIMSNQGLECYLANKGKSLVRTKVGDKHVVAKLDEEGLALGGEPSGHILIRDYLASGDGIFVALKVLESLRLNNNWDMQTFEKFPQALINVPVSQKKDLGQDPYACIIAEHEKELGNGRLVVRYSGTECLLRVMVEATCYQTAHSVAKGLASRLQDALKNDSL